MRFQSTERQIVMAVRVRDAAGDIVYEAPVGKTLNPGDWIELDLPHREDGWFLDIVSEYGF